MKPAVVLIGIGEMGGVFARGFLRAGYPVYPVTRNDPLAHAAGAVPEPALALLAVAEKDFAEAFAAVPEPWRERLGLLQNELLPAHWAGLGHEPTVISVWFEKKKGQDVKVLIPSPIHGPHAGLIAEALNALSIPTRLLSDPDQLLFELVRKNLYILTTNIAGLRVGGNVEALRRAHRGLMEDVARDVLAIQEQLSGHSLPWERLIEAMEEAFDGDPEHKCMGRSAPARLERALAQADAAGLEVPTLRAIEAEQH